MPIELQYPVCQQSVLHIATVVRLRCPTHTQQPDTSQTGYSAQTATPCWSSSVEWHACRPCWHLPPLAVWHRGGTNKAEAADDALSRTCDPWHWPRHKL